MLPILSPHCVVAVSPCHYRDTYLTILISHPSPEVNVTLSMLNRMIGIPRPRTAVGGGIGVSAGQMKPSPSSRIRASNRSCSARITSAIGRFSPLFPCSNAFEQASKTAEVMSQASAVEKPAVLAMLKAAWRHLSRSTVVSFSANISSSSGDHSSSCTRAGSATMSMSK
jgi:hypothetical protein